MRRRLACGALQPLLMEEHMCRMPRLCGGLDGEVVVVEPSSLQMIQSLFQHTMQHKMQHCKQFLIAPGRTLLPKALQLTRHVHKQPTEHSSSLHSCFKEQCCKASCTGNM